MRKQTRSRWKTGTQPLPQLDTHRPLSSSFLGLPYGILNINHKKELLRGLWINRARRAVRVLKAMGSLSVGFALGLEFGLEAPGFPLF